MYPKIHEHMTEHSVSRVLRMSGGGSRICRLLLKSIGWRNYYTFKPTVNHKIYIEELNGYRFDTIEQAEVYAFLDFCDNETLTL